MIFCDDATYRHAPCKQCGRELKRYLSKEYDKYGVYLCSEECLDKFMMNNVISVKTIWRLHVEII